MTKTGVKAYIVAVALLPATVWATDLNVAEGDVLPLSGNATYGSIVVNGTLQIAAGASITASSLVCGTNSSGSAVLTVGAGATVTITGQNNNGLNCCLGYNSPCSVTLNEGASLTSPYIVMAYSGTAQSVLTLNNASCMVNTVFYFCRNSGASTVDPSVWTAEVRLVGPSAVLKTKQFVRNQRGSARILFEGGRLMNFGTGTSSYNWLYSRQNIAGTQLSLQGVDDHPVILQLDLPVATCFRNEFANTSITVTGSDLILCGGSDTCKLASDTNSGKVLMSYTGRLRVKSGSFRLHSSVSHPVAAGISVEAGAELDLNGCAVAATSLTAPLGAVVTNTAATAATLTLASDSESSVMEEGVCGDIKIVKAGTAAATFVPGGGISALTVSGGTFRVQNRSIFGYRHYRFLPTSRFGTAGSSVQYNEVVLYGTDGASMMSQMSGYEGGAVGTNSDPALAVDGDVATKYFATDVGSGWLRIDYPSAVVAGFYAFANGDDYGPAHKYQGVSGKPEPANYNGAEVCRDVTGWKFQGSSDGTNFWTDLETVTGFIPEDERNHMYPRRTVGYPNPVCSLGDVEIVSGATLSIEGQRYSVRHVVNGGTLNATTATFVAADGDATFYPAAGAGVEKSGDGTSTLYLSNAVGGKIDVSGGTLRIVKGGAPGPYFRFKLKKASGGSTFTIQLSEFALHGVDGSRLPMSYAGAGMQVSALGAGCATLMEAAGSAMANLFDGDTTTDANIDTRQHPDDAAIILRTDGTQVAAYRIATGALNNAGRKLVSWSLEESADGNDWTLVDEHVDESVLTVYGSYLAYNGGLPYYVTTSKTDNTFVALEPSASIALSGGGVLDLSGVGASPVGGISVDCASGGGTVVGFNASADGVLEIVGLPTGWRSGAPIGVTLSSPGDMSALSSWRVTADGRSLSSAKIDVCDGKLYLIPSGLTIIVF